MRSWFIPQKNKPQEIVAIDIGTASVFAVLARTHPNGIVEIVSVLQYPFDLLGDFVHSDKQKKIFYMLRSSIAKAFADAHHISRSVHHIRISFADPFFEEHELETIINRRDSKKPIMEDEINLALKDTKGWNILNAPNDSAAQTTLTNVMRAISQFKVNGYPVEEAIGCRGSTLEIRIHELSISSILKDYIADQKEKFYPDSHIQYYSDPSILRRAVFAQKSEPMPILVVDIGGEVTTLFILKDLTATKKCSPIFFGVRTLERRIATFLRIDRLHAESIIRQYADEILDDNVKNKIKPIINAFLVDWYASLRASLKNGEAGRGISQVLVAGSGKEILSFIEYLAFHIKEFSREESDIKITPFSVKTDMFLPPKSLSEGGDVILASLLLYG